MVSFLIDGAIVISAMSKIGLIDNFHNIEDDTFRVTRCDDNVYAMERIPVTPAFSSPTTMVGS